MENNTKIALITGGGRGLGKEMALRLAGKGIHVIITYYSRQDYADDVVVQIEKAGGKAAALHLNVAEVKTFGTFILQLKELLQQKFGTDRFDFLINNGGVGRNAPIGEVSEEMFDELMNVHFKGVYFLTQQLLDLINDGGSIINISTGLARMTISRYSAYASVKGAVETFTRYLAAELAPRGIKANIVAPGAIATDFSGGHVRDNEEVNSFIRSITALGRAGQPEDIGGVVAFLCSDDARWITAQRIEVSGGMKL
jgi:NAD(P)-dependent dehydrogenase (short-subunit alcohol dehydrogenase family)